MTIVFWGYITVCFFPSRIISNVLEPLAINEVILLSVSTMLSNSISSPAIEFKKEGIIFGLCVKMFTVAGPVIVNGTIISIIVGIIYLII